MIQVLGDALRRVGAIPAPLGFRHLSGSPAVSPHQSVRGRGLCSCRRHLATAVASQERFPGCAARSPWRGSWVWSPAPPPGQRGGARLNSPCTCRFGVGVGVDGCWAGIQALTLLPDRPAPAAPWSNISMQWWQPRSRWLASLARDGKDTWNGWKRFTARCWGRRRPPGDAAAVSGGTAIGSSRAGPRCGELRLEDPEGGARKHRCTARSLGD